MRATSQGIANGRSSNFADPVMVTDQILMGPVLIVHDSDKMARGQACTTFYRFDPSTGPKEELVSFHCRPDTSSVVQQTTFSYSETQANGCKRLLSYQIAGESEVHGIPTK